MQDLANYVYMPLWLVITLTLMAGVGFEFLVYRVIRLMKRAMTRAEASPPLVEIASMKDASWRKRIGHG